jgi:archaellum component FlaC
MKTLDFFEDLGNTFEFVPMSNLMLESTVEEIVTKSHELETAIERLETRVFTIQKDIETIAELGIRLSDEASRKKLQELAEDFMMEHDINEMRSSLEELYGNRQTIAKCLRKLAVIDDNLNYTCGVCLERNITVFSTCGHTMCTRCSNQVDKCPYCRERTHFKRLVFSS